MSLLVHIWTMHITWNVHALNQTSVCMCVFGLVIHIHLIHIFLLFNSSALFTESIQKVAREKKKFHMLQRSRFECIILLSKTETINTFPSRSVWESLKNGDSFSYTFNWTHLRDRTPFICCHCYCLLLSSTLSSSSCDCCCLSLWNRVQFFFLA